MESRYKGLSAVLKKATRKICLKNRHEIKLPPRIVPLRERILFAVMVLYLIIFNI